MRCSGQGLSGVAAPRRGARSRCRGGGAVLPCVARVRSRGASAATELSRLLAASPLVGAFRALVLWVVHGPGSHRVPVVAWRGVKFCSPSRPWCGDGAAIGLHPGNK